MSIKDTRLTFTSSGKEAIQLESILHHPGGKNLSAAVVCHPHSLYGGSMNVSLVVSIAQGCSVLKRIAICGLLW